MIAPEREQFLQRLALFRDLDAGELRALAEVAQVVQFPASALICREGEAGDCAYVVVPGSVQVFAIDRNGGCSKMEDGGWMLDKWMLDV